MSITIDIKDLEKFRKGRVLFDVRSPIEFEKAHIPGAINFPLFSNEERAIVGTAYKQEGKEKAYVIGLEFAGAKMSHFLREARNIAKSHKVIVHCWRGGKRSQSMSWLLQNFGFEALTLIGGYKTYRNHVLNSFKDSKYKFVVLGGKTGCAKTEILHHIHKNGEQLLDLEGIARHKGSAFGALGEKEQPSTEHFENCLYAELNKLDPSKRVWVENESKSIGKVYIPRDFWNQLKAAPLINIERDFQHRVKHLIEGYAVFSNQELTSSFDKIKKRLGGLAYQNAVDAIAVQDYAVATEIALKYYDRTYLHGLETNISPEIHNVKFEEKSNEEIATKLINYANENRI